MKPILIVEDEANIRGLIALSLRRSGYETVQAKDGAEAADLLEKQMFDLVLLDVMLPEIDGFTLIDYILPKSIFISTSWISRLSPGAKVSSSHSPPTTFT